MQLTIELPAREEQLAFNQSRWEALCRDRYLATLEGKFETTSDGRLLYMPPPHSNHAERVLSILRALLKLAGGNPLPECPVSTMGGVRVPDLGWYSDERHAKAKGPAAYEIAPEICVEVLSPDNTRAEMNEKRSLYFDAGAREVWECAEDGRMTFFLAESPDAPAKRSSCCPGFPDVIAS